MNYWNWSLLDIKHSWLLHLAGPSSESVFQESMEPGQGNNLSTSSCPPLVSPEMLNSQHFQAPVILACPWFYPVESWKSCFLGTPLRSGQTRTVGHLKDISYLTAIGQNEESKAGEEVLSDWTHIRKQLPKNHQKNCNQDNLRWHISVLIKFTP